MNSNNTDLSNKPVKLDNSPKWVYLIQSLVHAGFPSPAEDMCAKRIDLNSVLISHPTATYPFANASVAEVDGEFTVKRLFNRLGRIKLQPANPTYPDILFKDGQELKIWGVVIHAIKSFGIKPCMP